MEIINCDRACHYGSIPFDKGKSLMRNGNADLEGVFPFVKKDDTNDRAANRNLSVQTLYESMAGSAANRISTDMREDSADFDEKESENKTEIIVKPDGSRVLVVTMYVGGMESTMCLELSKPTGMLNDASKQDNDPKQDNDDSMKGQLHDAGLD